MSVYRSEADGQQEPSARSGDTSNRPPILATCRARLVGDITLFAECLTQAADPCVYRIPFGMAFFCWHPAHSDIAARTRHSKRSGHP